MIEILTILALIFSSGFIASLISRKFGLPLIPFLIICGIVISQYISLEELSEILIIGLLFLTFYIGLRTDLDGFKDVSADSLSISLIEILFVFSIGFSIFYSLFELTVYESLYLGLAASLTSTLAGTDFFEENLRTDLHHGKISTGVNLVQDMLGVILISVIGVGTLSQGITVLFLTSGLLIFALLFRELLSSRLQSLIRIQELRLLLLVSILGASIIIGSSTEISIIASCFIGGLTLSKGLKTEDFLDSFESIKDFFSVIAFVGLGALVSLPSYNTLLTALTLLSLIIGLRAIIIFSTMLLDNHSSHTAFKTTGNLLQTSELALAAALIAFFEGLIGNNILEAIILTTAASMIFVSLITRYNDEIFERTAETIRSLRSAETKNQDTKISNHIIVAGFDTRGQKVARVLEDSDIEFIVIDYNKENLNKAKQREYNTVFGDLLNSNTWKRAGLKQSKLVICTSSHDKVINHIASLNEESIVLTDSEEQKEILSNSKNTEVFYEPKIIEKSLKRKIEDLINN